MQYDYTTSHPCGLEVIYHSLRDARAAAKSHLKSCKAVDDFGDGAVFIDQYDLDAGEMADRWWKVK